MAGTIITITSGKGGVGKTTTTANLSMALAMLNMRVVMIDADIGLRNLDIVTGLESRVVYDIIDVAEGRCDLRQALVRDYRVENLYLLPASQRREKDDVSAEAMLNIAYTLKQMSDFVIVDSPAGIEHGFRNAVIASDLVYVVTTPDVSAVRDADKVIYLLERDHQLRPALILNRYNPTLVRRRDMMSIDHVLDILNIDLLGVVPEDSEIVASTNQQAPIVLDMTKTTGMAYRNIAQRILGNDVPLMRFREPGPFAFLRWLFGG